MANVPGLAPQQDRPEAAAAKKARVLLNTSGSTERFTPVAAPVDRFVAPPDLKRDTQAEQLVRAMGNFGKSLATAGGVMADNMRDQADLDAKKDLESMTFEEAKKQVDEGIIDETDNPYYRAAFMRQYGTRTALEASRRLEDYLVNDFDPDEDDIEEVIATMATENTQGVTDKFYLKGFNDAFEGAAAESRDKVSLFKAQRRKQETLKGIHATWLSDYERMTQADMSPKAIHESLRATYEGNHKLLNVSKDEQDGVMLQTVASIIENMQDPSEYAIVEEILTGKRGGPLPLNQMKGDVGDAANGLLAAGEKKRGELYREQTWQKQKDYWWAAENGKLDEDEFTKYHESHEGVYTREQYFSYLNRNRQAIAEKEDALKKAKIGNAVAQFRMDQQGRWFDMFMNGKLHMLDKEEDWIKENGDPDVITKSRIEDQVMDQWFNTTQGGRPFREEYAERHGLDEAQLLNFEVDLFAKNNMDHPKIKSMMEAGVYKLDWTEFDAEQINDETMAGFGMYKQFAQSHPNYIRGLVDSTTEKFYEMARLAQNVMKANDQQALFTAHKAMVNLNGGNLTQAQKSRIDEVRTAVSSVVGDMDNVAYPGTLTQELVQVSEMYAALGMNAKDSREAAKEYLSERYISYNGMPLPATPSGINEKSVPMVDQLLQAYFVTHPEEMESRGIDSWEDMTLIPRGDNGQLFTIGHGAVYPMPMEDFEEANFDIADLNVLVAQAEQEAMESAAAETFADWQKERERLERRDARLDYRDENPNPLKRNGGIFKLLRERNRIDN